MNAELNAPPINVEGRRHPADGAVDAEPRGNRNVVWPLGPRNSPFQNCVSVVTQLTLACQLCTIPADGTQAWDTRLYYIRQQNIHSRRDASLADPIHAACLPESRPSRDQQNSPSRLQTKGKKEKLQEFYKLFFAYTWEHVLFAHLAF